MTSLAFCVAIAAFALLGFATDAHHGRWHGSRLSPDRKQRLRTLAWLAFPVSFALTVGARGWVMGPVVWSGLVMLAAAAVFLFLNFVPPPSRGAVTAQTTRERTDR